MTIENVQFRTIFGNEVVHPLEPGQIVYGMESALSEAKEYLLHHPEMVEVCITTSPKSKMSFCPCRKFLFIFVDKKEDML